MLTCIVILAYRATEIHLSPPLSVPFPHACIDFFPAKQCYCFQSQESDHTLCIGKGLFGDVVLGRVLTQVISSCSSRKFTNLGMMTQVIIKAASTYMNKVKSLFYKTKISLNIVLPHHKPISYP